MAAAPAGWRAPTDLEPVAFPVIDGNGARRGDWIIFEAAVQRHRDATRVERLDGVLIPR